MVSAHPDWYKHDSTGAIIAPNPDWTDVAGLDYRNEALRSYMIEMFRWWVRDVGIDGFRCDVAELVPTDFWERARQTLDSLKPVMMLSEGSLPEHHVHAFDITYAWNIYDVLEAVIHGRTPATVFGEQLAAESREYPQGSIRMRFNTNHDKNAWDAPASKKFSPQGAHATAVLMFTLPGVPLIYNGEEAGNEARLDLFEKVPIDWNRGSDARALYTTLAKLHRDHAALRRGEYKFIPNSDSTHVVSCLRNETTDTVLTVINFASEKERVTLFLPAQASRRWKDVFSGKVFQAESGTLALSLSELGYALLIPEIGTRKK
jgi:glycosidase